MAIKVVRSELPDDMNPYTAQISPIDEFGQALVFPYSPESYRVRLAPRWNPRQVAGAERDSLQWEGNSPRVISFEHVLTVQNVWVSRFGGGLIQNISQLLAVDTFIEQLETWARRPTVTTQRPTRVVLSLGAHEFMGVITSFDYERLQQSPEGYALTARITFELSEL